MARLKAKGDLAELKVASDLLSRGHRIALPYGEDCDYDLICDTGEALHRIQVKYAQSDGRVLAVRCGSHSLTNGKVRRRKLYTAKTIDWIAVYEPTSDRCYYVPANELGGGRAILHLRLRETRNGQRRGVHFAADYESFPVPKSAQLIVEPAGLEPATSRMQTGRSSN
jgi:PD-(D/E)XK nuclease superfamily protein